MKIKYVRAHTHTMPRRRDPAPSRLDVVVDDSTTAAIVDGVNMVHDASGKRYDIIRCTVNATTAIHIGKHQALAYMVRKIQRAEPRAFELVFATPAALASFFDTRPDIMVESLNAIARAATSLAFTKPRGTDDGAPSSFISHLPTLPATKSLRFSGFSTRELQSLPFAPVLESLLLDDVEMIFPCVSFLSGLSAMPLLSRLRLNCASVAVAADYLVDESESAFETKLFGYFPASLVILELYAPVPIAVTDAHLIHKETEVIKFKNVWLAGSGATQ